MVQYPERLGVERNACAASWRNVMITLPVGAILFVPLAVRLEPCVSLGQRGPYQDFSEVLRAKSAFLVDSSFIART
jgi:hypothetical protein